MPISASHLYALRDGTKCSERRAAVVAALEVKDVVWRDAARAQKKGVGGIAGSCEAADGTGGREGR